MKKNSTNPNRNYFAIGLIVFLSLFLTSDRTHATHMAGADLTYSYIGNNQYLVTYTFYRDCIGIDAQTFVNLVYGSDSCGFSDNIIMFPVPGTGQQITFVCPGTLTTCDGGTAPGIQKWEYTAVITLNQACPDWNFSVTECCRNAAITTLSNPIGYDMYIEANLNNTLSENSSPVFSNIPIAFECIGQNNYYNHGAIDAEGDSLVYAFIAPRDAVNGPVNYLPGYSIANPLSSTPPVSINQNTGDVFIHPTASEVSVFAVLVQEYRNGILIGSIIRDIQVYTVQCNNELPLASGINGTANFTMNVCLNGPICFDILSSDLDTQDSLTMTWNNGIPGATFTSTTAQRPVGNFCWTPDISDVRTLPYIFSVTVRDNACPSNGVQSFSYAIYLSNLAATVSIHDVSCNGGHNGGASIAMQVPGVYEYIWTPGEFVTPSISHLTAGNYTVLATNSAGCSGAYSFTISEPPPLNVTVSTVDATCSGQAGSASAVVTGGTPAYTYMWNTNPPTGGSSISGLVAGTYSLTLTDDNQCSVETDFVINGGSGFTAEMSTTPATCNATDGTASVSTSGGSGDFTFTWNPSVSTDSIATGLTAGMYDVSITDNFSGCIVNLSDIVHNTAGIVGTVVSTSNATCENGEDGTAEVSGSGGTAPYFYNWQPGGATTAVVSNLSPGEYVVEVADYVGCPDYVIVNIGFDFPAPVVDLGNDTVICIGSSITLQAGAGFDSYLWSDNSTLSELTVSTEGVFSVLVSDANGCENFDAIMVDTISCQFGPSSFAGGIRSRGNYIFPNPATNELSIVTDPSLDKAIAIKIFNSHGELVFEGIKSERSSFKKIDITSFAAGLYLVHLNSGGESKSMSFIKE